jgi:AraC-like DNA-binding protein
MRPPESNQPRIFEFAPRPALRPFVQRLMVAEFPSSYGDSHLPDTRPVAAFTFRGRVRLNTGWAAPAAFTALRETLREHEHVGNHAVVLVTFTAVGAAAVLRASMEEFVETTTDLTGLLGTPSELERVLDRLASAPDHRTRVRIVEEYLVGHLPVSTPDPLVSAAVDWLERTTPLPRVDHLARRVGLSQSALERRFRRVVGIAPKRFASLIRLRRAVELRHAGHSLTSVAQEAGYFDQSHFIHHFRRATGRSPDAYFRNPPGA